MLPDHVLAAEASFPGQARRFEQIGMMGHNAAAVEAPAHPLVAVNGQLVGRPLAPVADVSPALRFLVLGHDRLPQPTNASSSPAFRHGPAHAKNSTTRHEKPGSTSSSVS